MGLFRGASDAAKNLAHGQFLGIPPLEPPLEHHLGQVPRSGTTLNPSQGIEVSTNGKKGGFLNIFGGEGMIM